MNGKNKRTMKQKKFRSWGDVPQSKGEQPTGKSKTMPDMEINPRRVIENHVRGINPITGAVLDRGLYYGENIIPYEKDLTYEELRLKRLSLNTQYEQLVNDQETTEEVPQDGTV